MVGALNTEYEILRAFDTSLLNSNMSLPYQNFLPSFDAFPSVLQTMSQKHRLIARTLIVIQSFINVGKL